MSPRRDPPWDPPADLVRRYQRGVEEPPTDPPDAPPPRARAGSRPGFDPDPKPSGWREEQAWRERQQSRKEIDGLESFDHALEKTDKRIKWIVGIGGAFIATAIVGWQARDLYQQATNYYARASDVPAAAAAAASAAATAVVQQRNAPLEEQVGKDAKRLDTLEKQVSDLQNRFEHATVPGKRRPMYPVPPETSAR